MSTDFNIYIGLDEPHPQAYEVCKQSILERCERHNVTISPVNYNTVKAYKRTKDKFESTQFAFARFFVPHQCDFKGRSVFVDGDFLFLDSIDDLLDLYDDQYAVSCCKHEYDPEPGVKMDGKIQSVYPKKNWSSLMLINNEHEDVKKLTPTKLNVETGKYLHRFEWVEGEIGSIPVEWNWLVGTYQETKEFKPKALHYTDGGPWLQEYQDCDYSNVWHKHFYKYEREQNI